MMRFIDRADGGRKLAEKLEPYRGRSAVVYGLPRGGVVTAKVVAERLGLPMDLIVTRKIGHPQNPEYALGAITDDGVVVLNEEDSRAVPADWLAAERVRQSSEAKRRHELYLAERKPKPVEGKIAILVDDGIATGYTMEAAIRSVRKRHPAKIVVAAPVAPLHAIEKFKRLADDVVIVSAPEEFYAIGAFYDEFSQVNDLEVLKLVREEAMI